MADERLVLAHGFTQTSRSWAEVEARVADRRPHLELVALDLAGHGDAAGLRHDLVQAADDLVARGGAGTHVGYSMGGRIALHAALAHPDAVRRLVLIGATAGIDDEAGRAERRRHDQELADRVVRLSIAAFVDEWLAQPLFAGLTDDTAQRDDRLRNTPAGLASSLRLCGTGTQRPLWGRLGELTCPTLVLVGERDDKFRAIGERLADAIPDARLAVVADAGHSVHLEQPDATVDELLAFLDDTAPAGAPGT